MAYSPLGNGPQKSSWTLSHGCCGSFVIFSICWFIDGNQYLFRIISIVLLVPRCPWLCATLMILFRSDVTWCDVMWCDVMWRDVTWRDVSGGMPGIQVCTHCAYAYGCLLLVLPWHLAINVVGGSDSCFRNGFLSRIFIDGSHYYITSTGHLQIWQQSPVFYAWMDK